MPPLMHMLKRIKCKIVFSHAGSCIVNFSFILYGNSVFLIHCGQMNYRKNDLLEH